MPTASAIVLDFEKHRLHALWRGGLIWFVLADVCEALGIEQAAKVAARLEADQKGVTTIHTRGGPQQMLTVSEDAVYEIACTSRKPIAKRFKRWLYREVLPEIRQTGSYQGGATPLDALIGSVQSELSLSPTAELPSADVVQLRTTESFPYHYHSDYVDAKARTDAPPSHTQAEWDDLPLEARQEWWEKYAPAVQLKNYNDDLLCGQNAPDETRTHERIGGDRWTDHHEGLRYQVINDFNSAAQRRLWITCNYRGEIHEYPTVAPDGSQLLVCLNEPFAPIEVIERNYDKLGHGPAGAIGKATLRHDLY